MGDRGDVRSGAQQIDFDQMSLTRQDFPLLGAILVVTLVARGLVGRADDLDRGDQPVLTTPAAVDFEERLDVFVMDDAPRP